MAPLPVNGSRVRIPDEVERPFQVFVNGVEQIEGTDFEVVSGEIVFAGELIQPRRETPRSYARLMFWGRYKPEHSVDLAYTVSGARRVAASLPILPAGRGGA
jgi:hypothetical protein